VDATAHLLDFLRRSHHAALLHLSTCYVAGARDGRVHEGLEANYNPLRLAAFDAEKEWQALGELVRRTQARAESPAMTEELRAEARKRVRGRALSKKELANHVRRYRSRWLRTQLTELGTRRARELGWPNTYTFTKSLAESLIARRGSELPVAIVRPSIVETSLEQPFRGWNEGINTSAPLSHLLGTYFRQLPTNERKCLDLIPVDLVCRGLTLIAATLLRRCHDRVYQLATSEPNPCNMERSIELTGLAHRKHYRAQEGLESWLRPEFATIPVSERRYRRLSVPGQRAVVRLLRLLLPLRFVRARLERRERKLARVEKIIELYEPFILHNEHVFEAANVARLSAALPEAERALFAYDAGAVDWWDYWINIHVPALRKWVYPLIEGRPPAARLPARSAGAADGRGRAGAPQERSQNALRASAPAASPATRANAAAPSALH
ncbi:MAG: SDR family oxidoreductase, partial [Terriglobia bacterium]